MNFSLKVNLDVFLCVNVYILSRGMSRDQKLKMKEIDEFLANLLYFDKHIGIS